MRRLTLFIIVGSVSLTATCPLFVRCMAAQSSRASLFYVYNSWKETAADSDVNLSEGVLGLTLRQWAGAKSFVEIRSTYTAASYDARQQTNVSFSSLNDTRLRGTHILGDRMARASISLNMPTGKKKLSSDEYRLAAAVSDNSRKLLVRRFGQGMDIGGELVLTPRKSTVDFQIGVGYLFTGSYQPLKEESAKYDFGNEYYGLIGIATTSQPVSLRADLKLKKHTADRYRSKPVYQAGSTVILSTRLVYSDRHRLAVGATVLSRGIANIPAGEGEVLTEEAVKSGRGELTVTANGSLAATERLRVLGFTEFKRVTSNDYARGSGQYRPGASYVGLSAGIGYSFSPTMSGSFMSGWYSGKVDDNNDLRGFELTMVLSFRY